MKDPRIAKLAKILVDYSINVRKGEYIQIAASAEAKDLVLEIYKLVIKKEAYPLVRLGLPGMDYIYYKNASMEQLKKFPTIAMYEVKKSQAYISIGADVNTRELTNIDPKRIAMRSRVTEPISDYIVNRKDKIRRVSLDFPTNALAQDAEMSLQEYEDFLFNATNIDWVKGSKRLHKIKRKFENADKVRIVGENTDISMSIKGRGKYMVVDDGRENMPGGELFCAPLEKTVNGKIAFTYPAIRAGREVSGIRLEFKNGKVVKASADKNEKFLKEMLNTDKGSKYIGELGIGCNPKINRFTKNLLFDEKINGTIHLALGMAYKENRGTNKSALHWDIVKDLKKNGKIILDGKVIQRNGKWLI